MNRNLAIAMACSGLMWVHNGLQAAPFTSFEPRSMAMGGAGVAVGNAASAPFFNPALLATTDEGRHRYAFEIPIVGARISDPEDFADAIDEFSDSEVIDRMDDAIERFNNDPALSTAEVRARGLELDEELIRIGGKPIQGELGAAVLFGKADRELGFAVTANVTAVFGGIINYEDSDTFNHLIGDLENLDICNEMENQAQRTQCIQNTQFTYIDTNNPNAPQIDFDTSGDNADVKSSVDVRALVQQEFAISLAREFNYAGHSFSVGVTPKYVKTMVLDYRADVDSAEEDDFDGDDYRKDYSNMNLDVGLVKDYENGLRAGVVIKNLIPQTYHTYRRNSQSGQMERTGNTIETNPQLRVGVSKQAERYTLAADLDLTENDAVDFDGKSRYLSLGAEFDAWSWAQLRAGYRANLSDSNRNVWSAGLGLSPFGVHLDLAIAGSSNEFGAAMQFGVRF